MSNVLLVSSTPGSQQVAVTGPYDTPSFNVPADLPAGALVFRASLAQGSFAVNLTSVVLDPTGLNIPLTLYDRVQDGTPKFSTEEIWYLLSPPAGDWSVQATASWSNLAIGYTVDVCSNVDQVSPWVSPNVVAASNTTNVAQPGVATPSIIGGLVLDVMVTNAAGITCGQTQDMREDRVLAFGASHQTATGASAANTWSMPPSANYYWSQIGACLRPSGAVALPPSQLRCSTDPVGVTTEVLTPISVTLRDSNGDLVTDATNTVTLGAINVLSGWAQVSGGSLSAAASGGVAVPTVGVLFEQGSTWNFPVTSPSLTGATTETFTGTIELHIPVTVQ